VSKLPTARPLAGLATAIVLAFAAAPQPAHARIHMSSNAGGACKPAYGASTKFNFTELYALNTSTTDQYLVCNFTDLTIAPFTSNAQPIDMLRVFVVSGASAGTVTCVAKMGHLADLTPTVASSATGSVPMSANSASAIVLGSDLPRTNEYDVLSMNCKLPGGFKLGLIQRWELEPTSGNGWTP